MHASPGMMSENDVSDAMLRIKMLSEEVASKDDQKYFVEKVKYRDHFLEGTDLSKRLFGE